MLNVDNINVFYGDLQALWDASFEVSEGEIVAIVGSNGAGKTTLFHAISGLLRPKSGSITFLEKEHLEKTPPYRIAELGIAHVPEGRDLFSHMSVMENLELGAYFHEAREKRNATLDSVFQLFPILKERKNQLAGTLSGGEQQMVAVGRALMSKPKLLMLDEPSLGLAPKVTLQIFETIEEINKDGVTILLVEQNLTHALEIADRGYVLKTGRVVLTGKGSEILKNDDVKKAYLGL